MREAGFLTAAPPTLPLITPLPAEAATLRADGSCTCGSIAAPDLCALLVALRDDGRTGGLVVRAADGAVVLTEIDIVQGAARALEPTRLPKRSRRPLST